MRKHITVVFLVLCLCAVANARERPFPPQVLSAKTLAVVAHCGFTPATSDVTREAKVKEEAEQLLRRWGRYQLVQDPDKADLVFLVFSGFGYRDVAAAAVFPGGNQPWSPMPLWIGEEFTTLMSWSRIAAITKRFQKDVDKQENKASSGDTESEKPADKDKAESTNSETEAPPDEGQSASFLPPEILQAKTAASVWRRDSDRIAEVKGEKPDKAVVKELQKWGHYTVVDEPGKADLIVITLMLTPAKKLFGMREDVDYDSVFIFKGGAQPQWSDMPLWTDMQRRGLWSGSEHSIRRLRKEVETTGAAPTKEKPAQGAKEPSGS